MRESGGTDSIFGGRIDAEACSLELRERVVEAIESGASRREAAEWFAVSPSSAIKWMQAGAASRPWRHADFLLVLIADQPDLTLDQIVAVLRKRRIAGSRSAVWRRATAATSIQPLTTVQGSASRRTVESMRDSARPVEFLLA
jgi:hypothetical protein